MIRENTVTQLYAGALIHMLNNNEPPSLAEFHICTSTIASDLAKECAKILGVTIHKNVPIGEYPLNEDVLVEVDKDGHIVSMTVEHAKEQTDVNEFSCQLATA